MTPTSAEIIATDSHGRPAILRRQTGRGALLLCTYPLEYMAAATPRVNPDATVTLLRALGAAGELPQPLGLTPLGETEIVDRVTLNPFGIRVLKIAES